MLRKQSLTIQPERVFYNLHDALAAMYADPKAGIEVVLGSKCPEYISDYFPNIKTLVKAKIKTISKSGGAAEILKSAMNARSEERRVGKECRSRWSPYH